MKTELVNIATGARLEVLPDVRGGHDLYWIRATIVGDEVYGGRNFPTVAWRIEKTMANANEVIRDLPVGTVFDLPVGQVPQFIIKSGENELMFVKGDGANPYTWTIDNFATRCNVEEVKIIYRPEVNS